MNKTVISWTTVTWNPTHGCSRVSEGCRNCYAEKLSLQKRFTELPWTAANADKNVTLKPHKLREPLLLKIPSRIFVNSMSDLFHDNIPDEYIRRIWDIMEQCPQHTFQILTKRPERAVRWPGPWLPNMWMGTSVENTNTLSRLDILRSCDAITRFVSFEPLIEKIDPDISGYHWAIVGGESGPNFRPMPHAWARVIRDVCVANNTAFFFKQSSAYRTELGVSLQHEDGSYWLWRQFPDHLLEPQHAAAHRYAA